VPEDAFSAKEILKAAQCSPKGQATRAPEPSLSDRRNDQVLLDEVERILIQAAHEVRATRLAELPVSYCAPSTSRMPILRGIDDGVGCDRACTRGCFDAGSRHQLRQSESNACPGQSVPNMGRLLAIRCDNGPERGLRRIRRKIDNAHSPSRRLSTIFEYCSCGSR
jgi:hypothetical protein